ncbi:MAG TPA: flagellar biosynthesis repressor FlbT [Sphingomonas sp.]|jgi:flagellar protein FlbT|nr:flagellar biosynthesis repressor FlbT [Sphingomonas sp.]
MLRISLRDGEKMIVNGAVLRATGRVELAVENRVAILRGREVMNPDEANTPARRLYLACMMAYVDEAGRERHHEQIIGLLGDLLGALENGVARQACLDFAAHAATGDYYRALTICRALMDYEQQALTRATATADAA